MLASHPHPLFCFSKDIDTSEFSQKGATMDVIMVSTWIIGSSSVMVVHALTWTGFLYEVNISMM
jgi:hypothetical protein